MLKRASSLVQMSQIQAKSAFSKALRVYGILVVELLALRVLFHSLLKVKIGWSFTTDFGLFIPLTFAFFIYWMVLATKIDPKWGLQNRTLRLHLILIGAFILFTSLFQDTVGIVSSIDRGIWFSLLAAVILSGMVLFVPSSFYLKNENKWAIIPCALIGISVPLYQHHYEVLWPLLGKWTGQTVCSLLPSFGMEGAFCKINSYSKLVINVFPYRAILAPGCVGLEGQLLNCLTVLIFSLVSGSGFKPLKLISYLILGSVGIFWINIFRILILMKLGQWSMSQSDYSSTHALIRFAFHSHAGWVFYGLYLGSLYRFAPSIWVKIQSKFDKPFPSQFDAVSK